MYEETLLKIFLRVYMEISCLFCWNYSPSKNKRNNCAELKRVVFEMSKK